MMFFCAACQGKTHDEDYRRERSLRSIGRSTEWTHEGITAGTNYVDSRRNWLREEFPRYGEEPMGVTAHLHSRLG